MIINVKRKFLLINVLENVMFAFIFNFLFSIFTENALGIIFLLSLVSFVFIPISIFFKRRKIKKVLKNIILEIANGDNENFEVSKTSDGKTLVRFLTTNKPKVIIIDDLKSIGNHKGAFYEVSGGNLKINTSTKLLDLI